MTVWVRFGGENPRITYACLWLPSDSISAYPLSELRIPPGLWSWGPLETDSIWSAFICYLSSLNCSFRFLSSILKSASLCLAESRGIYIESFLSATFRCLLEQLLRDALDLLLTRESWDLTDRSAFRPFPAIPLDDLLDPIECFSRGDLALLLRPVFSRSDGAIREASSSFAFCLLFFRATFFRLIYKLFLIYKIVLSIPCYLLPERGVDAFRFL